MEKTFNQEKLPIMVLVIGTVINIALFCIGWFTFDEWSAGIFYIGAIFGQGLIGFIAHLSRKTDISKQYSLAFDLSYIVLGCVMTVAVFTDYTAGDEPRNVIVSQQADFAFLTWLLLGLSVSVCRLSLLPSCRRDEKFR